MPPSKPGPKMPALRQALASHDASCPSCQMCEMDRTEPTLRSSNSTLHVPCNQQIHGLWSWDQEESELRSNNDKKHIFSLATRLALMPVNTIDTKKNNEQQGKGTIKVTAVNTFLSPLCSTWFVLKSWAAYLAVPWFPHLNVLVSHYFSTKVLRCSSFPSPCKGCPRTTQSNTNRLLPLVFCPICRFTSTPSQFKIGIRIRFHF